MNIILGSQSKSRGALLSQLGYVFETMPADIDEKAIRSEDTELLPLLLARAKSEALLPRIEGPALLVTSDQVVVSNGMLQEKPESEEEARAFLREKSEYPAQTNTAVVVVNLQTGARAEGVDIAKVYYRPIPDDVIERLIAAGDVFSAAGGFRIEDPLMEPYMVRLEGSKDSIMGLPLALTKRLIEEVS